MTHTGVVSKEVDFGKRVQIIKDFRETKNHFIDSSGDKFSKKNGSQLIGLEIQRNFHW